jgi:DNA ligase (NAD+)
MKIKIPTTCPCCDYTLELVNDQLFCRNQACSAQLGKKLEHFCKTLGIKGMGARTLEKLQLTDITEIYYLELDQIITALGSEKIAVKLLDEIDRSRNSDLATILPAFSIPLVGNTAAQKVAKVVASVEDITTERCRQAGLGEKVTNNLISWLETDFVEMKEFLPFSFKTSNKPVANVSAESVCITGKLTSFKNKAEATKALELAGFKVTETVTKQTNYLVDEDNKGSSKRTKADELGITIIENLSQFLNEKIYD